LLIPTAALVLYAVYTLIFGRRTVDDQGKADFNSIATRELRANNLLGVSMHPGIDPSDLDLTKSVAGDDGVLTPGVDNKLNDKLAIFADFQTGMDYGADLLANGSKYFGSGDNDIISVGNTWAGDTHYTNPLVAQYPGKKISDYAYSLYRILKGYYGGASILPFQTLHFATDGINVMKSIARMENGTLTVAAVPDAMYLSAIASAVNNA